MSTVREEAERPDASAWPVAPGEPLVFLAEASTPIEHQLIENWVERHRPETTEPDHVELIAFPHPHNDQLVGVGGLQACLAASDDPVLAPVRVVWLPNPARSDAVSRLSDVLLMRDPRNPKPREQERIVAREPERALVLVGAAARKSDLAERHTRVSGHSPDDPAEFARYVARQAVITLEREEAHEVDERYKLPRMVKDEIVASRRYREGVTRLARELDREEGEVDEEARRCLDEMVSGRSAMFIDFIVGLGRVVYRQAYEGIDYDPAQIERVRAVSRRHGIVVLPTHRSNFDAAVMPIALYDNHLPRTHTLGGINMAFWPIGPLSRRAGTIFIRRDTKDHPVYRWTLREYIGYLVEKRFGLQWYPEGTRSRTGKLMPAKVGLLVYAVDAYRDGRVDDVMLVPSSIAYDQLQEVSDFAEEVLGGAKKREGVGWLLDTWRRMRGRYGKIYVRFAEPISLRDSLGPPDRDLDPDEQHLQLQKLSFEVMWRINQVTPITGTALIALVLLSARGRAVGLADLRSVLGELLAEGRRRELPMTESAEALASEEGVRGALRSLINSKVVTGFEGGAQPVYTVGPGQHLAASFYRNSIVHFFLTSSIAELALVRAGEVAADAAVDEFWSEVQHLRDLLKFEFFFAAHDEFEALISAELSVRDTEWQLQVAEGREGIARLLERVQPLIAHSVLRSFFESYLVVAQALEELDPFEQLEERPFLSRCLGLGRQYLLQQRVSTPESVSKPLFRSALDLARHRGLDAPAADIVARRRGFSDELRGVLARFDAVEEVALEQFFAKREQEEHEWKS